MRKNIFVIGDLVIDHTIFVRQSPLRAHQPRENELVFEVIRRHDSAGGAANTARILAVLNQGQTFLWGPVGNYAAGTFQEVLEKNEESSESPQRVVFRALQEESGVQMHTISRVISVRGNPPDFRTRRIVLRFDEYEDFYLSDSKRLKAMDDLEAIHSKHGLAAVIINDLDLNCLSETLVKRIAKFCSEQSPPIALFVDPKFEANKYLEITATAVLPNLYEWLRLVGEPNDRQAYWRNNLSTPHALIEMAQLSLRALPGFTYYVIKCDSDGNVILCPATDPFRYEIYREYPAEIRSHDGSAQLGAGDILVGALALAVDGAQPTTRRFVSALDKATKVTESYLAQPWLKMPPPEALSEGTEAGEWTSNPIVAFSAGVKYLPKSHFAALSEFEVIEGLYTRDEKFKQAVERIIQDALDAYHHDLRSLIVGAPPGSGKSSLIAALTLSPQLFVKDISNELHTIDPVDPRLDLKRLAADAPPNANVLLVADEALKATRRSFLERSGVLLLNDAHSLGIKLMFVDSGFFPDPEILGTELSSRCRRHVLPSLDQRPIDISLILVSRLLSSGSPKATRVQISANAMVAIINHELSSATGVEGSRLSPRNVVNTADLLLKTADNNHGLIRIDMRHLPAEWGNQAIALPDRVLDFVFTN